MQHPTDAVVQRALERLQAARTPVAAPRPTRVCLLVMPDDLDFAFHVEDMALADAVCEDGAVRAVPGGEMREAVTFPHLRGVFDVGWVYTGWRGLVRLRQQPYNVRVLQMAEVASMAPEYAAQMRVGEAYQWVYCRPTRVGPWPIRRYPAGRYSVVYGVVRTPDPAEEPLWLT